MMLKEGVTTRTVVKAAPCRKQVSQDRLLALDLPRQSPTKKVVRVITGDFHYAAVDITLSKDNTTFPLDDLVEARRAV